MNATPAPSTYRRPEAKPAERITPHQVLILAGKFGGKDHDLLVALKNQMIDDIQKRVALRQLIEADAPKAEILKAMEAK